MEKELYRKAEVLAWKIRTLKRTDDNCAKVGSHFDEEEFKLTFSPIRNEHLKSTITLPGFLLDDLLDDLRKKTKDYIEKYQNEFFKL